MEQSKSTGILKIYDGDNLVKVCIEKLDGELSCDNINSKENMTRDVHKMYLKRATPKILKTTKLNQDNVDKIKFILILIAVIVAFTLVSLWSNVLDAFMESIGIDKKNFTVMFLFAIILTSIVIIIVITSNIEDVFDRVL